MADSTDKRDIGLMRRYRVERIDGKDDPEGTVYFCVRINDPDPLDQTWREALAQGAEAHGYFNLAHDLRGVNPGDSVFPTAIHYFGDDTQSEQVGKSTEQVCSCRHAGSCDLACGCPRGYACERPCSRCGQGQTGIDHHSQGAKDYSGVHAYVRAAEEGDAK